MAEDARSNLAAALTDSMQSARACLDVAEYELDLAIALNGDEGLRAVPSSDVVQLSNATAALEGALREVLRHVSPEASRSLGVLTQLRSRPRPFENEATARAVQPKRGAESRGRLIRFPARPFRPTAS